MTLPAAVDQGDVARKGVVSNNKEGGNGGGQNASRMVNKYFGFRSVETFF